MSRKRSALIGAGLGAMRRREIGAAMVEFAIILPILLLFVGGILELGRLFTQLAWVNRGSYEAVFLAGLSSPATRDAVTIKRMNQLYGVLNREVNPGISVSTSEDTAQHLVTVRFAGSLRPMLKLPIGDMNLGTLGSPLSLTGPNLLTNPPDPGNLTVFSNPATVLACGAAPGCACAPGQCNTEYSAGGAVNVRKYDINKDLAGN